MLRRNITTAEWARKVGVSSGPNIRNDVFGQPLNPRGGTSIGFRVLGAIMRAGVRGVEVYQDTARVAQRTAEKVGELREDIGRFVAAHTVEHEPSALQPATVDATGATFLPIPEPLEGVVA